MRLDESRSSLLIVLLGLLLLGGWVALGGHFEQAEAGLEQGELVTPTRRPSHTPPPTAADTPESTPTATPSPTPTPVAPLQLLPMLFYQTEPVQWNRLGGDWPAEHIALCRDIYFAASQDAVYAMENGLWAEIDSPDGAVGIFNGLEISPLAEDNSCRVYLSVRDTGVFTGTLDLSSGFAVTWTLPLGGDVVSQVRAIAVSGQDLFAAGEFGLSFWNGMEWDHIENVPGDDIQPIMDLAVADTDEAIKPVYAVRWFDPDIWWNPDPGANPTDWVRHPSAPPLFDQAVRVIHGDETGPTMFGSNEKHYRLITGQWQQVVLSGFGSVPARAFAMQTNSAGVRRLFAGYIEDAVPGGNPGVYVAEGSGPFDEPLNDGWSDPPQVYDFLVTGVGPNQVLVAATSSGVWVYPIWRLD